MNSLLWLSLLGFSTANAEYFCPIFGPTFPKPTSFDSSTIKSALSQFEDAFQSAINDGDTTYGALNNESAYSVQFFSTGSNQPLLELYHTPEAVKSGSIGVNEVDGDTIFRVASVSKVFTVYTLLLEIGDVHWEDPITKYVPELDALDSQASVDEIRHVKWSDVTIGALAGQIAGIIRDLNMDPVSYQFVQQGSSLNLPELSPSELPQCVSNNTKPCDRQEYFQALGTRKPVYAPNTTPVYSNAAYEILAFALETMTGKPFAGLMQEKLIDPLSLNGASYTKPSDEQGVIPGAAAQAWWNFEMGPSIPAGGIYASANALSSFGRSILDSTLLDANTTRAWLKPTTHTSSLMASVGRPWEIYRIQLSAASNRVVDVYTKSGALPFYQSTIGLIPDYNVGWVALGSGQQADVVPIDAMIGGLIGPALEDIAREEAHAKFAGTYKAEGINSTVVLSTTPGAPGLGIESYIVNGTDVTATIATLAGSSVSQMTFRVYPTELESVGADGKKQVAFRMVADAKQAAQSPVAFSACRTWATVDTIPWAHHWSIDEMVFELEKDESGASALLLNPFKTRLQRTAA